MYGYMEPASEEKKPEVFCIPVDKNDSEVGIIGQGETSGPSRKGEWYLPSTGEKGHGVQGTVHEVCKNNDCDYVMKIIIFNGGYTRKHFLKEVELQKEAFRLNVAPELIDSWICKDPYIGVIIMPALQRTLEDILRDSTVKDEEKDEYIKDAFRILHILNGSNIFHRDSHLSNFMVDSNKMLKIIDFGSARKLVGQDTAIPKHDSKFFLFKSPEPPETDDDVLKSSLDKLYVPPEMEALQAYKNARQDDDLYG